MTQYIDKSAVVAKIRERLLPVIRDRHYDEWEEGQDSERIAILHILDALEVKGVDLEKEKQTTMKLYHVTTPRKAKRYRQTGCILSPVRGFNNLTAAMAWAIKVNRSVILEFDADKPYKLPDHHNKWGEAWWNDGDVKDYKCVYSIEKV